MKEEGRMSQDVTMKPENGAKPGKAKVVKTDSLRVRRETKKRILAELASLNKKDFGRPVTPDDYVVAAIALLEPKHLEVLRARTLSNKDRLEQKYREYCAEHGKVSKDEYLGVLLSGGEHT
jgi:hypothetical protein